MEIKYELTKYGSQIKAILDSKKIYQAKIARAYGMCPKKFSKMLRGLSPIPSDFTEWFAGTMNLSFIEANILKNLEIESCKK